MKDLEKIDEKKAGRGDTAHTDGEIVTRPVSLYFIARLEAK